MDALRVRLRFAGILSAPDRRRLVAAAIGAVRPQVDEARAFCDHHRDDPAAYWLGRGALLTAEARIRWLEEMRANLES
jgi:fructoselysine-6-P-deglycase FrlB-like protein